MNWRTPRPRLQKRHSLWNLQKSNKKQQRTETNKININKSRKYAIKPEGQSDFFEEEAQHEPHYFKITKIELMNVERCDGHHRRSRRLSPASCISTIEIEQSKWQKATSKEESYKQRIQTVIY